MLWRKQTLLHNRASPIQRQHQNQRQPQKARHQIAVKLQETGAVYRMTYTGDSGIEDQLMFEQDPVGESKRREYKVLRFDFEMVQGPNSEVRVDLTPSAKETMKLLNTLAVEGFVVRDLFVSESVSNSVSVLLERSH